MVTRVSFSDNPRGTSIIAGLWTMTGVSLIFLGLRIYTKLNRGRTLWWDDYLVVASWCLLVVSGSTSSVNAGLGFGLHLWEIPLENLVTMGLQSNVSGSSSLLAATISKTSFALTLLRLSNGSRIRWLIWGLIGFLNATHLIGVLFFWVSCNPPEKGWDVLLPGECWPSHVVSGYQLFVAGASALCDFTLAFLPWKILLRYDMYNREKIGVALAMSMGVFAGAACIVKMTTIPSLFNGDFSYHSLPLILWGFMEPTLTIIATSIPFMRHLFKSMRRSGGDPFLSSTLPMSTNVENSLQTNSSSQHQHQHHHNQHHVELPAERPMQQVHQGWKQKGRGDDGDGDGDGVSERSILTPPVVGRSTTNNDSSYTLGGSVEKGLGLEVDGEKGR